MNDLTINEFSPAKNDLKRYISNKIEDFVQLYNLEHKYL